MIRAFEAWRKQSGPTHTPALESPPKSGLRGQAFGLALAPATTARDHAHVHGCPQIQLEIGSKTGFPSGSYRAGRLILADTDRLFERA